VVRCDRSPGWVTSGGGHFRGLGYAAGAAGARESPAAPRSGVCGQDSTLSKELLLLCHACGTSATSEVTVTGGEELLVTPVDLREA
jgi:hypothetical protein